jgi:hypothetical protein
MIMNYSLFSSSMHLVITSPIFNQQFQTISASPWFSSSSIVQCIESKESLIQQCTEQGLQVTTTTPTAFPTVVTCYARFLVHSECLIETWWLL